MVKKNACIFISGKGSNLKKLIIRSRDYNFPVKIKSVVTNNKKAEGLIYAKKNSIPIFFFNSKSKIIEKKLISFLIYHKISLICLAGYMKIISKNLLGHFNRKIINIHPSLLPKFKGLNTFSRVLKKKERKTGCTVHYVNEKLDSGRIIIQKGFFISPTDTESSIKKKTQKLEHLAFSEAILKIFRY